MKLTKEELIFLSDNILARMTQLGNFPCSSKEMRTIVENDLLRLEAINSVICSEIQKIPKTKEIAV